jgi:hypothetical protein
VTARQLKELHIQAEPNSSIETPKA